MQVKLQCVSKWPLPSDLLPFRHPSHILPACRCFNIFPNESLERLLHSWQLADWEWHVGVGGQVGVGEEMAQGQVGGQAATAFAHGIHMEMLKLFNPGYAPSKFRVQL